MCDVSVFRKLLIVVALAACSTTQPVTLTAGPRSFDSLGQVRKWPRRSLRVAWTGEVPKSFTAADIDQLVSQSFETWALPTSTLRFRYGHRIDLEQTLKEPSDFQSLKVNSDILVVFSSAFERIMPQPILPPEFAQAKLQVAAEAWERDTSLPSIGTSFVGVDNTKIASREQLFSVLLHEFGHVIGLEHSAINWPGEPFEPGLNLMPDLPVMTPVNYLSRARFHEDEKVAASALYPTESFRQQFGWIEGEVVDAVSGEKIDGIQVIAIRQQEPGSSGDPSPVYRYSCITPYGRTGNEKQAGRFRIAVPPGNYQVTVETIRPGFFLSRVLRYREEKRGQKPARVLAGMRGDIGKIAVN